MKLLFVIGFVLCITSIVNVIYLGINETIEMEYLAGNFIAGVLVCLVGIFTGDSQMTDKTKGAKK